jgi:hypothetical protein
MSRSRAVEKEKPTGSLELAIAAHRVLAPRAHPSHRKRAFCPRCWKTWQLSLAGAEKHALDNSNAFNPRRDQGNRRIGIVSVSAAIANALFHATSRRIRFLLSQSKSFF